MLTVRRDGCTSGTGGRREGCLRACAQPQNPPQNHISRCWCLLKSPKRSKDTSQRSTELKLATGILYCNLCCWGCTFTSNVPDRSRWCPPPILSSDCPTWCPLNQTFQLSPGSDECTVIQGPALLRGPPGGEPHTSQVGNSRLQATSKPGLLDVLRGATDNNLTQTTFDATVQIEGITPCDVARDVSYSAINSAILRITKSEDYSMAGQQWNSQPSLIQPSLKQLSLCLGDKFKSPSKGIKFPIWASGFSDLCQISHCVLLQGVWSLFLIFLPLSSIFETNPPCVWPLFVVGQIFARQ